MGEKKKEMRPHTNEKTQGEKRKQKKTKPKMLRRLVIKHGHGSKRENTCRMRGVVHEAGWAPLEITAGQCFISQAGS
jgi:hypothetical protein